MKEEIRDYKLVRWYPSLPTKWDSTHSYQYNRKLNVMVNITLRDKKIAPYVQSMPLIEPDFIEYWEKNKSKPLFITEDGVEVYDIDFLVFAVRGDFLKIQMFALEFIQNKNDMKSFYHESNADEYIWQNRRVFSYKDIEKFQSGGEGVWYDIKAIAKERSEQ